MDTEIGGGATTKTSKPKSCFVISPIGSHGSEIRARADDVREYIIRPAVEQLGYLVQRADDIADPGMIMQQVVDAIIEADLVVADLTSLNANVLYELAIRHETGKPVVVIADRSTDVPFDINQTRTVFFEHNQLRSAHMCREAIREQVENAERDTYQPDNPIVNAKNLRSWRSSQNPNTQLDASILSALSDISSSISRFESRIRRMEIGIEKRKPKIGVDFIDIENVGSQKGSSLGRKHLDRRVTAPELEELLALSEEVGINLFNDDKFRGPMLAAIEGEHGAIRFIESELRHLRRRQQLNVKTSIDDSTES